MKTHTGLLNYFVDLDNIKLILDTHKGIDQEVKKFTPKSKTAKAYMSAYKEFLTYRDTLDMSKFNFKIERVESEVFGTKEFYKTDIKHFFWSEIFEAIHLNLV